MKQLGITLLFVLLFWSCEKDRTGTIDPDLSVPYLLSASLNTAEVNIDTDTSGTSTKIGADAYRITVQISGKFLSNGIAPPYEGTISIVGQTSTTPLDEISLHVNPAVSDTVSFSQNLNFVLHRSDAGFIRCVVRLQTLSGSISNSIDAPLHVSRRNSRPQITAVTAPDTVVRPASGIQLFTFTVAVSDSDGYNDIKLVSFTQSSPSQSAPVPMFDDGNQQVDGDAVAGDGIFSRTVFIDSSNTPGQHVIFFLATDQTGAVSDSIYHTFTIVP